MTVPVLTATRRDPENDQSTTGPALVLGNSLGTDSYLWHLVVEQLPSSVRVLIWDLPGHGESAPASARFAIEDLTDAVLALVEAEFGADTPFVYAGDSVSGQVGFELASRNLPQVKAVVPVCSAPRIGTVDSWAERAQLVRAQGTEPLVPALREGWFAPGFVNRQSEVAEAMLASVAGVDRESYALLCEALGRFDAWADLEDTLTRIHLVLGGDDSSIDAEQAGHVADQAGNAEVTVLDGVGHQAPVEAPERLAAVLTTELDR